MRTYFKNLVLICSIKLCILFSLSPLTFNYILYRQEIRSSVVSTQIFDSLSQTSRSKPLPESKIVMTLEFNINKVAVYDIIIISTGDPMLLSQENISNPIAGCYFWDFIVGYVSTMIILS